MGDAPAIDASDLLLIGLGVIAVGVALSVLTIVFKSRKYGWNIVSHELGKRSGKIVPRFVSLIYLVGLVVTAIALCWWIVNSL